MSKKFADRVLSDMSSGVLVLNKKGDVVFCNEPASRMLEIAPVEEGSELHLSLINVKGEGKDPYNDDFKDFIFKAIFSKDQTHTGLVKFRAPSGRKYYFEMSSSYLNGDDDDEPEFVITLNDQTTAEEMKVKFKDSSMTFSILMFALCGWLSLYAVWEAMGQPFPKGYITHGVEVMGVILIFFFLKFTSLTTKDLGIRIINPKKVVIVSLIICACVFAVMCIVKLIVRSVNPGAMYPDDPFIDFGKFGWAQVLYIFTAGIQEFLARSGIQGNIKRIAATSHPTVLALIMSSMVFAVLHIHLGLMFMVGAAVLAGLIGIIYEKQETLLGVWIVHWFFGVSGTLLGFIDH